MSRGSTDKFILCAVVQGSVTGLEVPDRVVEIVGKLPLKDKENSEKQNKGTPDF